MPRAKTAAVIAGVVAAFAIGVVVLMPRPGGDRPAASATASGLSLYGYSDDGTTEWHLSARDGTLIEDGGTLNSVAVTFSQDGSSSVSVHADQLVRRSATSVLSGDVRVERDDGLVLTTDEMTWNESADTLEATATEFSLDRIAASGDRFTFDLRSQRASLEKNVVASEAGDDGWQLVAQRLDLVENAVTASGGVRLDEEGGATYTCDRLLYDRETRRLEMQGSVVAEFADGQMTADAVTVTPDGVVAETGVDLHLLLRTHAEGE